MAAALASSLADPASAQFNPLGRKRHPPHPTPQPAGKAKPVPSARTPAKGPANEVLIERYFGIALSQPGVDFPLTRLAQLYRERDGNLEALIRRLREAGEKSGPEQWNALVGLAGALKLDGQHERAIATYRQAIQARPADPRALLALSALLNDRGEKSEARDRLAQAVPHLTNAAEREQALRGLLGLSLDVKDFEAAKKYHRELVRLARGSAFVAAELGRELAQRNEFERAEVEFRAAVKSASGDARALGPALRDLGRVLVKRSKRDEARATLHEALRVAGTQPGLRREIYELVAELYRSDNRLRDLVTELEGEHPNDPTEIGLLASLYEETGQIDKALAAYRKVLEKTPGDLDTRLKVVQLLNIQGALGQVVKEYEALVRTAPRNPEYVLQLAEALIQRGERARALAQLKQVEAQARGDEEMLGALVDFYERLGEKERAIEILRRLTEVGSQDPRRLVELGDRYWQQGDKKKAVAIWQRLRTLGADRALALLTLGEAYLDHEMPAEALDALKQASELKPGDTKYLRAYASALERAASSAPGAGGRRQRYEDARRLWEQILERAQADPRLGREARQHIVTLWGLGGSLGPRVGPLSRRFAGSTPDLEAGRLLAEVQVRLRDYPAAERTLRRLVELAPGDVGSLGQLEHVLVLGRRLRGAIEVLGRLVQAEPKRAREYYQRMAQYALELYRDDEAIGYAARAVELSPDDAEGHRKLGELYRRRQATGQAIAEFRQAIAKNDRLFPVYFELGELLLGQGDALEADQLLRRVVRACPDDELVAQAARLSMQINLGRGTLESLEKELLPVALGNPGKPLYRRLLVEIYGAMAFPLVLESRSASSEQAARARTALLRIGERAVKPLLDALGDEQGEQQRIAIELLVHVGNPNAGAALFSYATGSAPIDLRVRAMSAVGALRDPSLLPKLGELLAPGGVPRADELDPVNLVAALGIARMRKPEARPWLALLLRSDAPSLRALGALGLGLLKDPRAQSELAAIGRSAEAGPLPRAASAFALGELGAKSELATLGLLAEHPDSAVRATAIVALARLSAPEARSAIAEALVSSEPELARAAAAAAVVLVTHRSSGPAVLEEMPEGRLDVRALLMGLVPSGHTAEERVRALVELGPELARAAAAAVQSSPEAARTVVDAFSAADQVGFGPLSAKTRDLAPDLRQRAEATVLALRTALVPGLTALASHPTADVRALAVRFLATRREPEAREVVLRALSDPEERVARTALEALAGARSPDAIAAVTRLLGTAKNWSLRLGAARALGDMGADAARYGATRSLATSARDDPFALVREAALVALCRISPEAARPVLGWAMARDPEPRVKETARAELGKL
jgi:cellulose synthase operon protein C